MRALGLILFIINLMALLGSLWYQLNFSYFRNVLNPLPFFPPFPYFILWETVVVLALSITLFKSFRLKLAKYRKTLNILIVILSPIFLLISLFWFAVSSFLANPTFTTPDLYTEAGYATIVNSLAILGVLNILGLLTFFLTELKNNSTHPS